MKSNPESEFRRQTSKHKPRASFRKGSELIFRKKLANHNRAILWVNKERHEEVDRLAEATGLTMTTVADTLLRFAISNCYVIDDEGKDQDLRDYLDSIIGCQLVGKNTDIKITEESPAIADETEN